MFIIIIIIIIIVIVIIYLAKTKLRLHDRKTEHFKALVKITIQQPLLIIWKPLVTAAFGKTDFHCKIKETLHIQELNPSLTFNVSGEKFVPLLAVTPHGV